MLRYGGFVARIIIESICLYIFLGESTCLFCFLFSPVTLSEAQRLAPEEVFDPGHEKQKNEMSKEEKKALRNVIKKRRRRKLVGEVMSSKITVHDAIKRNLHLQEKNR